MLDKAAADAERTRLERLQRAHQRNQHALTRTVAGAEARFDHTAQKLPAINAAIATRTDTCGDAFQMTIGDRVRAEVHRRNALASGAFAGPLPYSCS